MMRPWAPAYGKTFTRVLGAAGTGEDDLGDYDTPRTLRVYNSGAALMFFAVNTKSGVGIGAALPGVPVGAGQTVYVHIDTNQRYFVSQSTTGTTFYVTPGANRANGGT